MWAGILSSVRTGRPQISASCAPPSPTSTDKHTWKDVIPHRTTAFVENFEVATDFIAIKRALWRAAQNARTGVRDGSKDVLIDAAEPAYTMRLVETPEIQSHEVRYVYTSLITPPTTIDYYIRTGAKELKKTEVVLGGFRCEKTTARRFCLRVRATAGKFRCHSLTVRILSWMGTAPLYLHAYGGLWALHPILFFPAIG